MSFIDRLRVWFPANRIAAISVFVAALAALLTTLAGAWPLDSDIAIAIIAAAALLTKLGVVLKFLDGSQQWDVLTTQVAAEPHLDIPDFSDEDIEEWVEVEQVAHTPQGLIRE